MKKLQYTEHLLNRINLRHVPKNIIRKILFSYDDIYFDKLNQTLIKIKKLNEKYYMVAFVESDLEIRAITIHQIKPNQIKNRVIKKRWVKYEENN